MAGRRAYCFLCTCEHKVERLPSQVVESTGGLQTSPSLIVSQSLS
jgi:hypothetical protein